MRGKILTSLSLVIFIADRLLKLQVQNFPAGKVFSFLPGITFGHFPNPALFFFPAWRWLPWVALLVLTSLLIFIVRHWFFKSLSPNPYPLIPIALGGASNVFDRFAYGAVIDYVNIWGFATINLADILIFTGLIFICLRSYDQRR